MMQSEFAWDNERAHKGQSAEWMLANGWQPVAEGRPLHRPSPVFSVVDRIEMEREDYPEPRSTWWAQARRIAEGR